MPTGVQLLCHCRYQLLEQLNHNFMKIVVFWWSKIKNELPINGHLIQLLNPLDESIGAKGEGFSEPKHSVNFKRNS